MGTLQFLIVRWPFLFGLMSSTLPFSLKRTHFLASFWFSYYSLFRIGRWPSDSFFAMKNGLWSTSEGSVTRTEDLFALLGDSRSWGSFPSFSYILSRWKLLWSIRIYVLVGIRINFGLLFSGLIFWCEVWPDSICASANSLKDYFGVISGVMFEAFVIATLLVWVSIYVGFNI